jgi:hypothetical protein
MNRRILILGAVVLTLAVPASSWADGGAGTSATHDGSRLSARLDQLTDRLSNRFARFSSRCLVANAPKRCDRSANRAVLRLDRLQSGLTKLESKIKTACAEANPPAACAKAGEITGKIDAVLAAAKSDEAAIKAKYPNAGSGSPGSGS